ncbi:hypothetical protein AVEN_257627-1 [Araneus ventricosus]|uniref:Uncharacterized protein n=1 Tax=Araneus ventricosus TaxID=182803 RepID=A0A4Y2E3G6_ARAVE|nr:hypothetical protein AVEN_257627-1 [Araneus ventricosus]
MVKNQDHDNPKQSEEDVSIYLVSHADDASGLIQLALSYVEQHAAATPTDVMFMLRWPNITSSSSSGKSVRNIAKLVNVSHSTVQYVIKRFKEENQIENKVKKGRPAKLTKRDQRFIIRKFVKNPCLSALKVPAEFNEKFSTSISPETVRRVLGAAGLNGRSDRRKFFASA